jgi:UDPglucose 6-dehydrogenase
MEIVDVNKISFIGLGKLGLPLATSFAKAGIEVIAIDKNEEIINQLKNGKAPFFEPDLQDSINFVKNNIEYQLDHRSLQDTDLTIILVNTPTDPVHGPFSNVQVISAIKDVCDTIKRTKKETHNFILSSTVMPGSINEQFIPIIENELGWTINKNFSFAYVPDFVALGSVIRDFETPNFGVIGQSNEEFGTVVESLYRKTFKNNPPIKRMNLLEGELAKIAFNTFIVCKLSFVNFLGNVCDSFGGANVDNITQTIGLDKRISANPPLFFKAGLSFGGACFPRDVVAFQEMGNKLGLDAKHIWAAEEINKEQDTRLIDVIKNTKKKKIGFLGVSFKPNTTVIDHSVASKITNRLLESGYEIHCHDFIEDSLKNFKKIFSDSVQYYTDLMECLNNCDVVVLLTPHADYRNIISLTDNHIIIDGWRMIDGDSDRLIRLGNLTK